MPKVPQIQNNGLFDSIPLDGGIAKFAPAQRPKTYMEGGFIPPIKPNVIQKTLALKIKPGKCTWCGGYLREQSETINNIHYHCAKIKKNVCKASPGGQTR